MSKQTLTLTREQALAIIQQAIGPELVPVMDFLTSCAIADAHRDACRAHNATDAETNAAEKVGVKVGQVWVGNESGIAVNVVELNGSDVGYKYLGGTGIKCTTPVDEFTVHFFLPNV
jgi:hypothetical protein